ncbi:MAG: hypothetical protein WBB07_03290 [Mycobacterium sp.]
MASATRINPELWARIWFVLFAGSLAYVVQLSEVGRSAVAGSQSVYLVVAPVLAGLVAAGYSRVPRGVTDAESDWIGAVLLCVAGFAAIWLVQDRLPTMAALWHLDNVGLLIWVAACGMVVFSARHVLRMWQVWLPGLVLAPVMPFMLMTSAVGGSDTAIALVSTMIATLAVYLAARFVSVRVRLLAATANLVLSTGSVLLLSDLSLYLRVIVGSAVIPLLVVLTLHRLTSGSRAAAAATEPSIGVTLPKTQARSYAVVLVAAIGMLCLHLPFQRPAPVEEVRSDWITASALDSIADYPFITNFLGPDATLTRYRAPGGAGEFQTVVDVMTSPDLARLQDFSNAVWYPSTAPVNYTPYLAEPDAPAGIKVAHTDADTATTHDVANWNAVTWTWRSGAEYQRVTVITSQSRDLTPPEPRALNLYNSLVEPALWLARQQPSETGVVDPIVEASTKVVVHRVLNAGEPMMSGDLTP